MKKIAEQLGGQMPPATIMQGMLLYEAYREEHCQKLFDNVFVRLASSEMRQQKDVLHMKHALEACATRHSDEATASQAGIKELLKGLRSHAYKTVVQEDGTISGAFKESCVWVMKLLAEEARGTEEQIALTAMLNACHIVEVNKQLSDRIQTAEDLIAKLQQQIDILVSQQVPPAMPPSKPSQSLQVQCDNGEKMELVVPKGQGFVSTKEKRISSMKPATNGGVAKSPTQELSEPSTLHSNASSGTTHAGQNTSAATGLNASSTLPTKSGSIGQNHISNGQTSRPGVQQDGNHDNAAESLDARVTLMNGKSKAAPEPHKSENVSSRPATGTTPSSWITTPATAATPDLTKPLPPPPAAVKADVAKVTLQTPGSSFANPLEIDDAVGHAPAKPKKVASASSSRTAEASPTLAVPPATFKASARSLKANASLSTKPAPTLSTPPKMPLAEAEVHKAAASPLAGTSVAKPVSAPSKIAQHLAEASGSSGTIAPIATESNTTAPATASPFASSAGWANSVPDWSQSQAKTTVTISEEYKPFNGTGKLTGRVPASALAKIDAANGPGDKASSPPRVISLAEAGIANDDAKKRSIVPTDLTSFSTSKPSFAFQQSVVALPGSSSSRASSTNGDTIEQTLPQKVSFKKSAVTIKSPPAMDGPAKTTNVTQAAPPSNGGTTNGFVPSPLVDVTNRPGTTTAASAYKTSSSPSPSLKATAPKPIEPVPRTPPRVATNARLSATAPVFSPPGSQRSGSRHAAPLPAQMLEIMDAASREKFMAMLEQQSMR